MEEKRAQSNYRIGLTGPDAIAPGYQSMITHWDDITVKNGVEANGFRHGCTALGEGWRHADGRGAAEGDDSVEILHDFLES